MFYITRLKVLTAMDNVVKILEVVFIGIAVASFLLQTCRYTKALELYGECLVILQKHSSKLKKNKLTIFYALIYRNLFKVFFLVGDYENAIDNGEKAFPLYEQIGDFEGAAGLLEKIADAYRLTDEQVKAKETYEKAFLYWSVMVASNSVVKRREQLNKMLALTTKIGNKEMEGALLTYLGDLATSRFEYAIAKDYFQRALAIWRENGKRNKEGRALYCLGALYRKTEEYRQAKQHYEEAVAIFEETGEMKELGEACGELGKVYNRLREFQKAKAYQQRALKESVKSGNKEGQSIDYRNLAAAHVSLREYREAKECYQKALAISKEEGNKKGEASVYSDLGYFYSCRNDLKQWENYCKKACKIYREIGDKLEEGAENGELGKLYCLLGKYDDARKCCERALAIKKEIGDRQGEGEAYCDLGCLYQCLGDYGKAKESHQQALAISVETNHLRAQGVDHGNLGTSLQQLGDYDKAYEHHKKALEIRIRTGHKEGLPTAYNHLGAVCKLRGEYANADKLFRKALTIAKETDDKRVEVNILCNLAYLEQTIAEHEKAIAHYREALQINEELNDIRQEAVIHSKLGTVYQSLGDLTTANKYFEKSLTIAKEIRSKRGETGAALFNLGNVQTSLGEYAKARTFYELASVEISRETLSKDEEMAMNHNLGMMYLSQNEFQEALSCYKRALEICEQTGDVRAKSMNYCNIAVVYLLYQDIPNARSYLSKSIKCLEEMRLLVGESEYYKIGLADENATPYRLMVLVLMQMQCIEMALNISELARARSLAEAMATQYSVEHLPGFNPNRWIQFGNVIQRKSCTGLSFCFVHKILFCWVLRTGKVEVATFKGLTTEIRPQGVSIQHWLETLADQSYRNFLLLQGERCEDRSLFLWDEDAEVRSPTQVEESANPSQIKEHFESQKDSPVLTDLYNIIIAPVLKFLEGSELIIVPDRSLYRIPFAALKDESGQYLSETFIIRVIPSLTTLKLIQDSPANYHSQKGVLIVGDPDVGTVTHQGKQVKITRLPFAKQETEMIGRLLHVHPLTGKQATKQTVLQRIHSVALIHIAAHGDAYRGDIALAPSNHHENNDFLLTMSDISKVQLRAKLVVLSCCHSGRGQIKAEGVVGIARAFLGSGARSVLVSLWAVDDAATMQFMKQFYGHLVRGKSASESLHETMKCMRENPKYCEVRKWAPFMLIGDDVSFDFAK